MIQSIDLSALDELDARLDKLLKEAPELRKDLHEELADMAKKQVDQQIVEDIKDPSGKVRGWQEKHVGSKGGYASIRPISTSQPGVKYGPAAITAAINRGHKIRRPKEFKEGYRARIHTPYVDEIPFYQHSLPEIEAEAIKIGQEFVEKMAKKIGGG